MAYVSVNGISMYYEVHGTGRPLILLHGGLGEAGMFNQILPGLEADRQVIAIDLQGHGHTALSDRPMSFEQMADDIASLITFLKLENSDILGYSLGGGVDLQTVIRHPELICRAVFVSYPFKSAGWYPEVRAGMKSMNAAAAKMMEPSPLYQTYLKVAPRPADWPELVARTGQLVGQEYDWSKEAAAIKTPTMLVFGDADSVRPSHAVHFFELLGGGQADAGWDGSKMPRARLAILPGTTHYNILASALLVPAVMHFLSAQS